MKPPVKTLAFLTIFFFSLTSTSARVKITSATYIATDVKKIIDDYPTHFENLIGELIIQNPQSSEQSAVLNQQSPVPGFPPGDRNLIYQVLTAGC